MSFIEGQWGGEVIVLYRGLKRGEEHRMETMVR
jgi:hypothetical protein